MQLIKEEAAACLISAKLVSIPHGSAPLSFQLWQVVPSKQYVCSDKLAATMLTIPTELYVLVVTHAPVLT